MRKVSDRRLTATLTFALGGVVAALCLGCGRGAASTPVASFKSPQVIRAFAAGGIRLVDQGPVLGTKIEGLSDEPFASVRPAEMAIEVFPTVRLASYAQAIGGNEEDDHGNQIKPLARVRNVLITLYPPTRPAVRQRVLKAVSRLQQLTPS